MAFKGTLALNHAVDIPKQGTIFGDTLRWGSAEADLAGLEVSPEGR